MINQREVIRKLNKRDKVMIVFAENEELFQGHIVDITDEHITINEYVSDIFRTFSIDNILEISKVQ